jgi:bifunctional ADP-heptose synthase (sugar kinase/adenylyltransferase)
VCGIDRFIVTRGSKGMVVYAAGEETAIGVVGGNDATDVTGAGDTVSAMVALSLACGASLVDAARMATYAASIVVMKRGTATASAEEIAGVIDRYPPS